MTYYKYQQFMNPTTNETCTQITNSLGNEWKYVIKHQNLNVTDIAVSDVFPSSDAYAYQPLTILVFLYF